MQGSGGPTFVEFVTDQLDLAGLRTRAMFGGHGLYVGGAMFGIVYDGRVYLRTDATTRERFVAQGMAPFTPRPGQTLRSYYEVPADVLEDRDELRRWAEEAARLPR